MAKKRRHRVWWYPAMGADRENIERTNVIGDVTNDKHPILFDDKMVAYGYAVARRMDIKRDDAGNVITNDKGYAQLHDHGKIVLIGVKGKDIDWKKAVVLEKPDNMKGDAISVGYDITLNKQTLEQVFEESDEMYNRYVSSPLGQAGGLSNEQNADAAEDIQPATES